MIDPSIRLNSNHVFLSQKFLPCDLLKAGETLDELETGMEKLCDSKLEWEGPGNRNVVKTNNSIFILLKGEHPITAGHKLCQSLGTSMVDVRNEEDAMALSQFMGSKSIEFTFANLGVDLIMYEVIYLSDGNVASGQLTDKIKFMWHGGVNEANWKTIIGYEKDGKNDLTGTFFMYRNTGKQIEIWANHEDNGGYKGIMEGNIDKKKVGIYK